MVMYSPRVQDRQREKEKDKGRSQWLSFDHVMLDVTYYLYW